MDNRNRSTDDPDVEVIQKGFYNDVHVQVNKEKGRENK